jgi:hypothetical protein
MLIEYKPVLVGTNVYNDSKPPTYEVLNPPLIADAAIELLETSFVVPQIKAWFVMGNEAGVIAVAFGHVVALTKATENNAMNTVTKESQARFVDVYTVFPCF